MQSKAFAAGNRAVHIRAGVGVIAHQTSANPMYGEIGFELLRAGYTPQQALDTMLRSDEGRDSRDSGCAGANRKLGRPWRERLEGAQVRATRDKVPDNDNAWVALANIHLKAGRKADALSAIAKAIEINAANKRQIPRNRNFESRSTTKNSSA